MNETAGGRVGLVTDSTASLSAAELASTGAVVVPLDVVWDGTAWPETELAEGHLVAALYRHKKVTTSRPSPEAFQAAYSALLESGCSEVVSVHLSGAASGTVEAARLGAADLPVHVVDSRQLAMGVGFGVLAAAEAIASGADGAAAAAAARKTSESCQVVFAVETLDYLRRGGRISLASAVVGQALAVKPILAVVDGQIMLRERVRTRARAMDRLVSVVTPESTAVVVQHLDAFERAEELAGRIEAVTGVLPSCRSVGAVVGAHVGPGVLGVALR